ncbi:MAG: DNA topoisomerase I [Asgard group archaeon]|nr:DNA topoisomerase I [Asgard group archaeon]
MSTIEGPYILGIAEKPQAAQRIARALDKNNKPEFYRIKNVPVYLCHRGNDKIVIAPALGHLFTLSSISKTWNYPVLDYEWKPNHEVNKSARTKNFIDVFKQLARKATDTIVMTDFDREGEVIGYLILKYIVGKDQAERMKFSTLTRRDIIEAFDNREKTLDIGFLNSGLIRHYVDWLYGINYSRALSLAFKRISGRFKTISIGRVQGPTLNSVVDLENEINLFLPIPYWAIESEVIIESKNFKASYERSKINNQNEALQIADDCKSLIGKVVDVIQEEKSRYPFPPFNLGDLQREAYIHFKYSPHKTLEIAEKLYLAALISYPRTDSQKLPMTLGHKSILSKLETQNNYKDFANEIILSKKFKPSEGRKTDAAHPAIHPTGNMPETNLSSGEKKLYDLIVKRYLSLFGKPASLSNRTIIIINNNHKFEVKGSQIIREGWIKYYKPYYSLKEQILPDIDIDSEIVFNYIDAKEHFTAPPHRYNESTLLRKMEDEKIGTKATRAGIIQTLFARGYVEGHAINATPLGVAVVSVLQEQYPVLVKSEMTRNLEDIMEEVQVQNKDIADILLTIKKELKTMLVSFHEKELEIGSSLYKNLQKSEKSETIILGKCSICQKGNLRIIKSKKT